MIRFHYHKQPAYLLPLGEPKAGRVLCCHVYSHKSLKELTDWADLRHIPHCWLHESSMPHFDLWGGYLRKCDGGLEVDNKRFVADKRRWRKGKHE